jgi:hypothetical protein
MNCLKKYHILVLLLTAILFTACHNNKDFLTAVKKLPSYPSASAIEYYKGHYYIMGDDATHLLVLDSNFNTTDSIRIYSSTEKRIPKSNKPDLEAAGFVSKGHLLLTGSGSLDSFRNKAVLYNTETKACQQFSLDTFYYRLKANGLRELNIEGMAAMPGQVILSNRGHKAFPKNHLIFTSGHFWQQQTEAPVSLIRVGSNTDSNSFTGVSGLAYLAGSDKLLLTVSTEDTRSVHEDGAIGKSYLWIIDDISSKRKWAFINPNRIIDLEETDARFKGQKIESVCITGETRHFIRLALAADNDDGSSTLFRLDVSKK